MTVNIYTEISSKAPKVTEKKYGYVLECQMNNETFTKEEFGEVEGSYYKAELTAIIKALQRLKPGNEIVFHSDNKFILSMIEKQLKTWADNDFNKSAGKPVANAEEWRQIWQILKDREYHVMIGNHSYTNWLLVQMNMKSIQQE